MNATHDDAPRQPGLTHNADEQASPGLTRNKADGVTPGEILREGRIGHDYSVDDLCAQTKLNPHTIEALEDNDFGSLSLPVFARGYYRQCAKVLDLDVDRLMAAYTAIAGEAPKPEIGRGSVGAGAIPQDVTPGRGLRFRGPFLLLVIAGVVIAAIVFWLPFNSVSGALDGNSDNGGQAGAQADDQGSDSKATPFEFNSSSDDNDDGAADHGGPIATADTESEKASNTPEAVGSHNDRARTGRQPGGRNVNKMLGANAADPGKARHTNGGGSAQSSQPAVPPNRLALRFDKRSWVQVTDANGNRMASGIFEAGDKKAFNGQPPYKLTLGFAPGVKATIGGQPVDIAGQTHSGTIAHLTVDAPDNNHG